MKSRTDLKHNYQSYRCDWTNTSRGSFFHHLFAAIRGLRPFILSALYMRWSSDVIWTENKTTPPCWRYAYSVNTEWVKMWKSENSRASFAHCVFRMVQFHIQQFTSIQKFATLHCCSVVYLQHGEAAITQNDVTVTPSIYCICIASLLGWNSFKCTVVRFHLTFLCLQLCTLSIVDLAVFV